MLNDYLNSLVFDKYDYYNMINVDKTIENLLLNIECCYYDYINNGFLPAKKWLDNNIMPFSQGNNKLPASTYIINLGCANLCPGRVLGTCCCCDFCYAKNAETQYKEQVIIYRLLQTLRWRSLSAEDIAFQLLEVSNNATVNKMKCLRINESGDVFDENDIIKMSKISDILKKYGIITYTYSSRYDLDWSVKSDNLIVNGSGWMCDNSFIAVPDIDDYMEYVCSGDCDKCDYCKLSENKTIYVKIHGNGR